MHGTRASGGAAAARVTRGLQLLLVLPREVVDHVERRINAAVHLRVGHTLAA